MSKNNKNLKKALAAIAANLPNLKPGVRYKLEQLTGEQFWSSLTSGERKGLGIQFKAHARDTGSPVQLAGLSPDHCQLYQLP